MNTKSKLLLSILSCVFLLSIFASCAPKAESGNPERNAQVVLGAWDGDTFTNEWANFTFTLPEGMSPVAKEVTDTLVNQNSTLVNGDDTSFIDANTNIYFDFALQDSNGIITVCTYYVDYYDSTYVDMQVTTFASRLSQAFEEKSSDYKPTDITVTKLGEIDDCVSFSVKMNEYITITFYINKVDGFFNVWQISEYERQPDDLQNFIDSVKKIK